MYLFGLKGLTWDLVPANYWVLTVDLHGLVSGHADVPKYATAASKWTSNTRKELGLVQTHHEDNPASRFEVRPGLTAPAGFPQVITPKSEGLPHQLRQLEPPKATPPPVAQDVRGTIAAPHMAAMMNKRNDNTDPTVPLNTEPVKPEVHADPVVLPPVVEKGKAKKTSKAIVPAAVAVPPPLSSAETVYSSLTHILRVLQELKAVEPNYKAIDHHVGELERILVNRWPIKEFKG